MLPFGVAWPTGTQFGLALLLGVLASGGQWIVILAHRLAPASLLAPFFYSQLVWVSILGFVVFRNLPDRWTLTGAGIIIASGLYTAHREKSAARALHWSPNPARACRECARCLPLYSAGRGIT